jgi:hypothetical protein
MSADHDVELVALRLAGRALHLVVRGGGEDTCLAVGMPDATAAALAHLYGSGTPRCTVLPDAHVDLLLRSLLAADATARLVIRRHGSPAFRLRVDTPSDAVDVDLDILDAVPLLTSGQFPILLAAPGRPIDWDAALRTLASDPGTWP